MNQQRLFPCINPVENAIIKGIMSEHTEIITGEFTDAAEVENHESLKRGIFLLLSSTVQKEEHKAVYDDLKESIAAINSNVQLIASRMEEGFKRIDKKIRSFRQAI